MFKFYHNLLEATGKQEEPWTVFCDSNSNGQQDDGEESISFTMQKKCKKIISGTSSINCGAGDDGGDNGGGDGGLDCNCSSKPKDCPTCDSECVAVDGKKISMKFTCPAGSDNAGASITLSGKCKKIGKKSSGLSCDGNGGGGGGETVMCDGTPLPAGCKNCKKLRKGKC